MALLTARQQRAILMIVIGGAGGISLTRLLKTSYSCPHCGLAVGRGGETGAQRKAALAHHIVTCRERPQKWNFAVSATTYYNRWKTNRCFTECLNEVRAEFANAALGDAARILQLGTLEASRELVRQISEGEKDRDRRAAACSILDRVDLKMADRTNDKMMRWLAELRGEGEEEEMASFMEEMEDIEEDWPSAE
jgi:hypothetical protein